MMMVSTDPMTSCGGDCEAFAQFFHRQWPPSGKEARILIPDAAVVLTALGLQEPVDVAFIGTSAIFKILSEDASLAEEDKSVVEILSRTMFELAAASKDSWTELTVRRIFREVDQAPRRVRPPPMGCPGCCSEITSGAIEAGGQAADCVRETHDEHPGRRYIATCLPSADLAPRNHLE